MIVARAERAEGSHMHLPFKHSQRRRLSTDELRSEQLELDDCYARRSLKLVRSPGGLPLASPHRALGGKSLNISDPEDRRL